MATQTASKPLNLNLLLGELQTALPGLGLVALTTSGGELNTNATKSVYGVNGAGQRIDLPASAATVISNHNWDSDPRRTRRLAARAAVTAILGKSDLAAITAGDLKPILRFLVDELRPDAD